MKSKQDSFTNELFIRNNLPVNWKYSRNYAHNLVWSTFKVICDHSSFLSYFQYMFNQKHIQNYQARKITSTINYSGVFFILYFQIVKNLQGNAGPARPPTHDSAYDLNSDHPHMVELTTLNTQIQNMVPLTAVNPTGISCSRLKKWSRSRSISLNWTNQSIFKSIEIVWVDKRK